MSSPTGKGAHLPVRAWLPLGLAACLSLALAGCGAGKNQAPVASEEEVGQVSEVQEEKPLQYTAKSGDTLKKIAARPEIYGDPELWPILQSANADIVGQGMRVNMGTVLNIPRDLSVEQMDEAREKARQAAAASKMSRARRPEPESVKPAEQPTAVAEVPTPVPAKPVPKAKKSGGLLSLLVILLLVLAALGAVLYYYSRRDEREGGG